MILDPQRDALIAGDISGWLEHRSTTDGSLINRCLLQPEGLKGIVPTGDGREVIVCGADRLHKVDLATMTVTQRVTTGVELGKLVLSADGRLVYGGSTRNSRLTAWHTDTLEVAGRFDGLAGPCRDLSLSPDGRWLACASHHTTRVWPSQPPRRSLRLQAGFNASGFGVAPAGKAFATSNSEGLIRVWDAESCDVTFEATEKTSFSSCALTEDAVFAAGESLVAFDLATKDPLAFEQPSESVHVLECSSDGQWLVGLSVWRERLFVWRTADGKLLHDKPVGGVCQVIWNEQLGCFLVASRDKVAALAPAQGTLLEWQSYSGRTWQLAARDDHIVAAAGKLWTQRQDHPFAPFAAGNTFGSVAISTDGRRVAAGDNSGVVRLFDLEGSELLTLADAPRPLLRLAFVLGGRRLVGLSHVSGNQCFVMVWGADLPAR